MDIEVEVEINAPPAVVFRFYRALDHLCLISPKSRVEWCPEAGTVIGPGAEAEVRIQQGRHGITVRFRTVRFEVDRLIEDEILSWPLRGARHRQEMASHAGGTRVISTSSWDPPWYLRKLVERHAGQQRTFFVERQENAKRIIEAVYAARGDSAFREGILGDAALIGAVPVVPQPEVATSDPT